MSYLSLLEAPVPVGRASVALEAAPIPKRRPTSSLLALLESSLKLARLPLMISFIYSSFMVECELSIPSLLSFASSSPALLIRFAFSPPSLSVAAASAWFRLFLLPWPMALCHRFDSLIWRLAMDSRIPPIYYSSGSILLAVRFECSLPWLPPTLLYPAGL